MESTVTRVAFEDVLIAYRDSGAAWSANSALDASPGRTDNGSASEVPVVLVHGMGGDGHTWDRFARQLARRGRRVIVPDLRGHGRSAHADSYLFAEFGGDLLRLCDRIGLESADFVGHSLGGYAVSWLAMQRPELVRRLVIEEQPLPLRSGDEQVTLTRRLPSVPELWHATTSLLRHPRAVLAFDRSMTRTALEQFRKPYPEWWEGLAEITAPTLFLRGGPGGMVDPDKVEQLRAGIPDCTVHTFRCGHSIHRDRYHEFEAAVLPFLRH
ncbi:alpha/beta fold hydrolase [Nocardia sp. CC227C]|uniref:alpha/beta fold hydrolase n=1 Tax=Nocardia sp. CC227C TaxID=3044562 RepID=UPI00278C6968|nr:alpha/beta hydrolase [Nocardia sp. CC227C]